MKLASNPMLVLPTSVNTRRSNKHKTVVILGGLGFIGSHMCRALLKSGYGVRVFTRARGSRHLIADIEKDVEIVEGDIFSRYDVLGAILDAEILIHLAHTTVPKSSMDDPEHDVISNIAAAMKWLPYLSQTNVRRIYYVSSGGTVYGLPEQVPIDESHPTNPICSYGITKLALEKYMAMYSAMADIDCYLLRPTNVYGPGQQLHKGQGVISVLSHRILQGEPIEVIGGGESLRDYLYVEDLVRAVMLLLDYTGALRLFNISSGQGQAVKEIIQLLQSQLGYSSRILSTPVRGFDVPVNLLSSARLREETGWSPRVGLEEGIAQTIRWLQANNSAALEMA